MTLLVVDLIRIIIARGIEIGEFSDDSYYRSPYNGDLF